VKLKEKLAMLDKEYSLCSQTIEDFTEQVKERDAEIVDLKQRHAADVDGKSELTHRLTAAEKDLGDLKDELKKLREQFAGLRDERDKLAKGAARLAATRAELEMKTAETAAAKAALTDAQEEIEKLQEELEAMRRQLAQKPKEFDVGRALELALLSKKLVAKEHLCDHKAVVAVTAANVTTVGITFDDKTAVISNVLVGGPAFNSKKIFKGDRIVSIDGDSDVAGQIIPKLKGIDIAGSIVTLGLLRASNGQVEEIKLRRMANTQIADKRRLFELFTTALDGARKHRDAGTEKILQQALDLWSAEMLESYEQDEICINNVHEMQDSTDKWLLELIEILQGDSVFKKEKAKAQRPAPPPPPIISSEDLEKLRAQQVRLRRFFVCRVGLDGSGLAASCRVARKTGTERQRDRRRQR